VKRVGGIIFVRRSMPLTLTRGSTPARGMILTRFRTRTFLSERLEETHICDFETGKRQFGIEALERIAAALHMSPLELLRQIQR